MAEKHEGSKKVRHASVPAPNPIEVRDELEVLIEEILHLSDKDLGISLNDIAFQGFKPREFLFAVQHLAAEKGITKEMNKKNLLLLGLVCAARGSKINKIINSSGTSQALKQKLLELRDAYGIREGRPSGPTVVTLPRCLAVTAIPVSKIIHKDSGTVLSLPLTPSEVVDHYPLVLCMTHAGSLLPASTTADHSLAKAIAYGQFLMSKKFGAKKKKKIWS